MCGGNSAIEGRKFRNRGQKFRNLGVVSAMWEKIPRSGAEIPKSRRSFRNAGQNSAIRRRIPQSRRSFRNAGRKFRDPAQKFRNQAEISAIVPKNSAIRRRIPAMKTGNFHSWKPTGGKAKNI